MKLRSKETKPFKNLASFSMEILVQCPNCTKRACVTTEYDGGSVPYPTKNIKARFFCNNCYKPINENEWYGPVIISPAHNRCDYCGTHFHLAQKADKIRSSVEVKCVNCAQEKRYDVSYSLTYANSKQATDPYFGLQLWLQSSFDDNIFWAYNHEHLDYLKQYISAKLREAVEGGKHSLVWKLPNFIKYAKNRDRILKIVEKLAKK